MKSVRYIKAVDKPASRAGQPGDIRDLEDHDARELVVTGHVEPADKKPRAKKVKKDDKEPT